MAITTNTGTALTVVYTYSDDMLTAIQTGSTTYSFSYGDFALRSSTKIGSRTLASYSYSTDGNHYLTSLDYGNGDSVDYSYDSCGRIFVVTSLEMLKNGRSCTLECGNVMCPTA